ncbi:nucleotide-binding universal stress UspA family protein [Sphingobium sp. OAS761]|uniref:universal stress protein n=1 Tax=Sphingobium sp. OAS761 TaxID=2817901 RepID=UPI00209DE2FD|nr:universal stress protein [Sphingobium sp. OAS761]MCP1472023.1 nucleotide-binding universal stress UspA family protein [Sphingobium sp. OAS761]
MKTVLLHIHDDLGAESRLQAACDLARARNAHVRCVQVSPMPDLVAADVYGGAGYAPTLAAEIHAIDDSFRDQVEARLAREDIGWDWVQFDGDIVSGLLSAARLADIVVATLPEAGRADARSPLPIVPELALGGRTPVLAVPQSARSFPVAGRALVAWDGSPESCAALRAAVPLLRLADGVDIVTVEEADKARFPATGAPEYLARHGVGAELHSWPRNGRAVEDALRAAIGELAADWLVMGAFGHSRLREFIFGGVTRAMLHNARVPILLAH